MIYVVQFACLNSPSRQSQSSSSELTTFLMDFQLSAPPGGDPVVFLGATFELVAGTYFGAGQCLAISPIARHRGGSRSARANPLRWR